MFLSKDFIETKEGLVFAVLDQLIEQGRVLCFLRYIKTENGYQKLATGQANSLLARNYPDYLFHSSAKDADLHAVPVQRIQDHYQPVVRLQQLISQISEDPVIIDLQQLIALLAEQKDDKQHIGVTGSLLIGAQNPQSDIDLVIYDRDLFFIIREKIQSLISRSSIQPLSHKQWQETFNRRDCELNFDEYLRHEQRKFNKAMINRRKFDLALLDIDVRSISGGFKKVGPVRFETVVSDDTYSYDYPAVFELSDPKIKTCLCYTATYTGQAKYGERVNISGLLEQAENGEQRVIVGSSREAKGEWIKVVFDL